MPPIKNDIKLARLLNYILGRRPDEFGLVPDTEGYIAIKELIKVLHEEKWGRVRPAHLETLPYRLPMAGIEMTPNRIRAGERDQLPQISACPAVPKQLFTGIRRKAYAATAQNGLTAQRYPERVVLFADLELARRVGRRRDADPLIVTVQTTVAQAAGVQFERFGQAVYLATGIPANCCRLPPPPKPKRARRAEGDTPKVLPSHPAGSYTLDWDHLTSTAPSAKPSPKKSKQWRRERKRLRRMKRIAGDDP